MGRGFYGAIQARSASDGISFSQDSKANSLRRRTGSPDLRKTPPDQVSAVSRGTVDPHQSSWQRRSVSQDGIDPRRKCNEIAVERADNDPCMHRMPGVEPHEMPTVERHERPLLCSSEGEHRFVAERLTGMAAFLNGHDVVTQSPEFQRRRKREVFVRVQECHNPPRASPRYAASFSAICCSISCGCACQ